MAELMRIQTGGGKLIVTDDTVTLEWLTGGPQSIARAAIASIDHKTTVPAVLGQGGAMSITIWDAGGAAIEAKMVPIKEARRLLTLLGTTFTATAASAAGAPTQGVQSRPGQKVVEYTSAKDMERGIQKMTKQGWHVVAQSNYQPRAGVGRIIAIGIFAAIFKPKVRFVVTFAR